jgi:hypothetical protein
VDQTNFDLRFVMKGGRVSPCEDGSQKTARLLKRECCRAPEWSWQLPGRKPVCDARRTVMAVCGGIVAGPKALPPLPSRGMKPAMGVARNYFLL